MKEHVAVGSYGSYIAETFVTLLLVCLVAVAVLYGARRFGIGRARGPIDLVGQLPLDARRAIYLVRVGKQVLVVGASEAGLSRLGEVDASSLPADAPKENGIAFKDVLARFRGRPDDSDEEKAATPGAPDEDGEA